LIKALHVIDQQIQNIKDRDKTRTKAAVDYSHSQLCDKIEIEALIEVKLKIMGVGDILRIRKDGQPCNHKGCQNHLTHSCENCGRIGAKGNFYLTRTEFKNE
jgi:hypothetical protein